MSVITASDVEKARDVLVVRTTDVITPLARDRAKELGIRLERSAEAREQGLSAVPPARNGIGGAPAARTGTNTNIAGAPAVRTSANTGIAGAPAGRTGTSIGIRGLPTSARPAGIAPYEAQPDVREPRSGALYRRGGYGFAGERQLLVDRPGGAEDRARPTIAVVGAGHVGAATGIRLAESDAFACVKLIDVVDGLAAGLALDMWHTAALRGFTTRVTGSADVGDVAGVDIVVVTAGRPRRPDMTRTDLTAANAEIIRAVATAVRDRAPDAVVIVVTNPVEEMTHLMTLLTRFPAQRVIGMGGVLDTARFRSLVALTGVARPEDVSAIVLGSHGAEMVIPLSQATVKGVPLEDLLDAHTLNGIVARTRESGAEVTRLLKAGSAYVSPGSAIARQVEAVVRGSGDVLPACVAANGMYGIRDVRIGLPVRLGPRGVREIVELKLRPAELEALRDSARQIRARTQALL